MQAADHRKGKGCHTMTLIGSIAGRGAAGPLFDGDSFNRMLYRGVTGTGVVVVVNRA